MKAKHPADIDPHALVVELLRHFGYSPEKIPEDPKRKTPDFRVETEDAVFIIELKSREEDAQEEQRRRPILEAGDVYPFSQPVDRRNTVSGLVDDAVEQLLSHDESGVYRLAWLYTGIQRVEMRRTQFKSSLYGTAALISLDWDHWHSCLYFTHSDFFKHRMHLDGAVVMSPTSNGFDLSLYLNDFAARYRQLAGSAFVRKFGDGAFLPHEREQAGEVLVADCEIDRRDNSAILEYLRAKYNLKHLQTIQMNYYEGTVLAPGDPS